MLRTLIGNRFLLFVLALIKVTCRMSNESSNIICTIENGIQTIRFNRPKKRNALSIAMYGELKTILQNAAENKEVCVVVVTGTGAFFSSGNEITFKTDDMGDPDFKRLTSVFKEFVDSLITFPKLLVAIVNGPAVGIAVTMLPLFDIVYASEQAYFYTPFTKLGLVAEGCSTYTFPRIMGKSKAGDMLYMGYRMNANDAKQVGLISDVYYANRENDVWAYLKKVSELSFESILAIKRLVKKWDEQVLLQINTEEAAELVKRFESPDLIERFLQFLTRKNKL